jgi:outer membrane biosynthesis protein TonB
MRGASRSFLVALLVAGPLLAGCSSSSDFDPTEALDKLDFFNLNKEQKLKGERKPLFPEGVPGVSQGIPPDLVKGHQAAETAAVVEEPKEEKPKPKPRVANRAPAKPAPKPTRVQVAPQQQQPQPQQAQQQQQSAWPDAKPQQAQQKQQQTGAQSPWPEPQKQTSPWPDAPPPNTFQR